LELKYLGRISALGWIVFPSCLDIATGGCLWPEARVIGGEVRLFSKGIKRGVAPLRNSLPSPLIKGRGIKGEGLIISHWRQVG